MPLIEPNTRKTRKRKRSSAERLDNPDAFLSRTDLHELGLERRAVDAVLRACPIVALPGYSRPLIRVADFRALLDESTYDGHAGPLRPAYDVPARRVRNGVPFLVDDHSLRHVAEVAVSRPGKEPDEDPVACGRAGDGAKKSTRRSLSKTLLNSKPPGSVRGTDGLRSVRRELG
jgi:hypothetical protein